MIRWYHAIFSAYGFWLPNDPRGSWSDFVGSYELHRYGPATKTNEKRSLAHDPHDRTRRLAAKQALKYPPVRFDAAQRAATARGIAQACEESAIHLHACAIGHDHVHLVLARHTKTVEQIIGQLKGRATQQMKASDCHPMKRFGFVTPWSQGRWFVFIDDEPQLRAAIAYVERHPIKEGLPEQKWSFVRPG